jgi:hypothetical protein
MKKKYNLDNLPDEFRIVFSKTSNQIRRFTDVIYMAKFAFLTNEVIFQKDLGDEDKNNKAIICQNMIYELYSNDKEYVDEKIKQLEENQEAYIQNLYAQGIVYLWTSLESLVKKLMEALINFDKEILTSESFRKVNIPMADFFQLGEDEKSQYLVDLIIKNISFGNKHGVEKFECYLDAFGLSGAVSNNDKKRILVLHHLRNCIVHNDSTADTRFCKQCSWLGYHVGDKLVVSESDFKSYFTSVLSYIQEIFYRLNENLGAPNKFLELLRNKIDKTFSTHSAAT